MEKNTREYVKINILLTLMCVSGRTWAQVNQVKTPDADNWGLTQINYLSINYTWTISNYSYISLKQGEFYESPKFASPHNPDYTWSLVLYPKGYSTNKNDQHISLYLKYNYGKLNPINARYEISILNSTLDKIQSVKYTPAMKIGDISEQYGSSEFIRSDYVLNKYSNVLLNNRLKIYVQFTAITGTSSLRNNCTVNDPSSDGQQYSDHLGQLLKSNEYSDVKLNIQNLYTRKAHKIILLSRSTYFKELLAELNMTEPVSLDASRVDVEVWDEVLKYMYTGRLTKAQSLAKGLINAANYYGIPGLMNIPQEIMCKDLNKTNAIDTLVFADEHNAKHLASQAANYIGAYITDFVKTPAFEEFEKSRPDLAMKIFHTVISKNN